MAYNYEVQKKYRRTIKERVIEMYGGKCFCCGEKEIVFLTIDHINGGGRKEREELGLGAEFYRVLLKQNKRNDIQILCYNCNCGKSRNNGICPHEAKLRR